MGVFAQPDVYLKKIDVIKKKRPELEKVANEKESLKDTIHPDIIKGVGEAALQKMAPGDFDYYKGKLVRVPTGGAAQPTLGNIASQVAQLNAADAGPGEQIKKVTNQKKKGSSLADFGRGLVEGVLGMPESVEGSSSRIPYALGQLPGTLARTKIGLPTSAEATHSAMQLPGTRQFASKTGAEMQDYKAPTWNQEQEVSAVVSALKTGKYALKGDFTGELARQDMKTLDDALTFVTYKGIDPKTPAVIEALKKYPVTKNGKVVGKFAGFDTDGEILVE